ncbi:GIY-YIG nuclease family protein [Sporosarcina gallistercoris]|uniref:GIY-YIG nuclease family protein n=1 Tax=Sporosarcina gallistercoris TaxID=2762245 RepID=UPI003D296B67
MEQMRDHLFYVLECNDGSYYGGYTTDLERRVAMHNSGKGAKYTRARNPVRCIHHERFDTKREAMQAEYRFKQLTRLAKERYLEQEEARG